MKEWVAVLRAADAAARWHVHQRRKGSAQEPYINHLLEVASLVAEATHGKDPELVIAALLHDAVEDQEVPYELIVREFGKKVADLVQEVSDDKSLDKEDRKERQVKNASKKSEGAKFIKLADKTSNPTHRGVLFARRNSQQSAGDHLQPGPDVVGQTPAGLYRLGQEGCCGTAWDITSA
jgi:(p)ppGpp synthase/HD superfamily hydrolase